MTASSIPFWCGAAFQMPRPALPALLLPVLIPIMVPTKDTFSAIRMALYAAISSLFPPFYAVPAENPMHCSFLSLSLIPPTAWVF